MVPQTGRCVVPGMILPARSPVKYPRRLDASRNCLSTGTPTPGQPISGFATWKKMTPFRLSETHAGNPRTELTPAALWASVMKCIGYMKSAIAFGGKR